MRSSGEGALAGRERRLWEVSGSFNGTIRWIRIIRRTYGASCEARRHFCDAAGSGERSWSRLMS